MPAFLIAYFNVILKRRHASASPCRTPLCIVKGVYELCKVYTSIKATLRHISAYIFTNTVFIFVLIVHLCQGYTLCITLQPIL